jgi:SAM-dependent methyltransferase
MDRFQNTKQPDWGWWGRLWPAPGETLRDLGLAAGDSVVEIGCGNGYFAIPAARIVAPAPVYAVDLDAALLAELDTLADQQGIENLVTVEGDARNLSDHLTDPVDVALLANTCHGIENPGPIVADIANVLTDDGRFIVINWNDRPPEETAVAGEPRGPPAELRLSLDETQTMVEDATELTLADRIDIPPYHYALVFERT